MKNEILTGLLLFYGLFLIICGIVAVIFIGLKAKTALISGGSSGAIILLISYLNHSGYQFAPLAGMVVSLALFIVFCWRSTKTLFVLFKMIPSSHTDMNGKGIAFLIISLMAVMSIFVFASQVVAHLSK